MAGRLLIPGLAFILALAVAAGALAQEPVVVRPGDIGVDEGAEIEIPILIEAADGIVGMHIEILYDPAILEYREMQHGDLFPSGAALEVNAAAPGRIVAGFASIDEVTGSGELLLPVFSSSGAAEVATIGLDNVEAWDIDGFDILIQTHNGTVTIASDPGFPIWLAIVIIMLLAFLVAIIALIILLIWRAVQGQKPAYVPPTITTPPPQADPPSAASEPHTMIMSPPVVKSPQPPPPALEVDQTQELPLPPADQTQPITQPPPPAQQPQQADPDQAANCPNCGDPITPGAAFCANCGYRLT